MIAVITAFAPIVPFNAAGASVVVGASAVFAGTRWRLKEEATPWQ